jgi:hypothetical protein
MLRAVLQVETQEQKVLGSTTSNFKLEAPDYTTTIAMSLTSDPFLVALQRLRPFERSGLLPPRPDGQPYTDPEIANRMKGLVSPVSAS